MTKQSKKEIIFLSAASITGWIALIIQFYVTYTAVTTAGGSPLDAVIKYFSYFTILTNLLVAVSLTFRWLNPGSPAGSFFTKPENIAAVCVYILVVGLVYNIMLRHLWNPQGLSFVSDELLHDVIPVLFFLGWFFITPKENLRWSHPFIWLVYPAIYVIYTVILGIVTGEYPYPFVDVNVLGYPQVMLNTLFVLIGFTAMGFVLVAIARIKTDRSP